MTTSLKLLIDSKTNKVVFAEADKAFVDFICGIMLMPMNSIIKLLLLKDKDKDNDKDKGGVVGSLGNVYKSIEALGNEHMHPNVNKDWLLKPTTTVSVPLLSLFDAPSHERLKLYGCTTHSCFSDVPCFYCPRPAYPYHCEKAWGPLEWKYVTPSAKAETTKTDGYVRGVVKYMVMDNLEIKPLTMALITSQLNNISNSMIEKEVQVGPDEGVAVLKASLETQTVLTAVFLDNKFKTEQ